jgi:hypothetical protein
MSELTIKSAASRNGAPGRLTGARLPMKNAYVNVKRVGPIQKNNTAVKKEERLDSP